MLLLLEKKENKTKHQLHTVLIYQWKDNPKTPLKENGFTDLNGPSLVTKKEWFYLGQGFLETSCIEAGCSVS